MPRLDQIKPKLLFGIGFDEITDFSGRRHNILEDFRNIVLAELPEQERYSLKIDSEGYVELTFDNIEAAFIAVGPKAIYANLERATSLDFLEQIVAKVCPALLKKLNRTVFRSAGLAFRKTISFEPGVNPISQVLGKLIVLEKTSLGDHLLSADSLNRIGFELRFRDSDYIRHLIIKADSGRDNDLDETTVRVDFDTKLAGTLYTSDARILQTLFCDSEKLYSVLVDSYATELFRTH